MNSHHEQRQRLINEIAALAPHYLPLSDLLGTDVGFGSLAQAPAKIAKYTSLAPNGRWIIIIGDDSGPEGYARGPVGFDQDELKWILGRCTHIAIYSDAGDARCYAAFVAAAMIGGRVAVIETQVAKYDDWVAHVLPKSSSQVLDIRPYRVRPACSSAKIDQPNGMKRA
jgi:hypothetical protein